MNVKRRDFVKRGGAAAFLATSLSRTLVAAELISSHSSMRIDDWLHQLFTAGEALKKAGMDPLGWKRRMDEIYAAAPLAELLNHIDYDALKARMDYSTKGECFIRLPMGFEGEDLSHERRQVVTKIAGVKAGHAVPPHGHENMVSAFLILDGEFHVRQFDRLKESPAHLYIRETANERQTRGRWSSISDTVNNCHWLKATGGESFLFSTKIVEIDPRRPVRGRIPFDYYRGQNVGSGVMQVPKL